MNNRRILLPGIFVICLTCSLSLVAFGQDETDILRYSQLSVQGTARSIGFGNTLGSVGGDFSSLSVNPAGIGIYRTSEISITPTLRFNNANYNFIGTSATDNNTRFNFNNFGAVFTKSEKGRRYKASNWKTVSFGIGFNRVADFNRNYTYRGINSGSGSSSATEVFAIDANQNPGNLGVQGTPAWMGYESYLIDSIGNGGSFYTHAPWMSGLNQSRKVKERGAVNELALSLGGNYREKLMMGVTIGVPTISYKRDATYSEVAVSNVADSFQSYSLQEQLTTTGLGINAKIGVIYKPVDAFRIGAAIHTPTAYAMTDVYDQTLISNTENYAGVGTLTAPQNQFDYSMTTPWRGVLSATGMFGKVGFITADYEYVNYASAHYNFRTEDPTLKESYKAYERRINQAIKDAYKAASNFRAGVEFRFSPVSARAGFGMMGSPYKNNPDATRIDLSAGLGLRFQHAYIDVGYMHSSYKSTEQPYVLPTEYVTSNNIAVNKATGKNKANTIAVTVGFKF